MPLCVSAQSDQHYTMFMYNKLLYNPGYTGSRDVTSVNAVYRNQWAGIGGGPKSMSVAVDAPVGTYMKPFRKVALGLSVNNEKAGIQNNTDIRSYYAYRIKLNTSVISFGLSGGVSLYSAKYNQLTLNQQNDPNFAYDIKNAMLPNFGTGIYWAADNFYCGLSVPNLLQNKYDKNQVSTSEKQARQIRAYYLSAGYVFPISDVIKLKPQALVRYAGNGDYKLPVNCDINLSAIAYDRLMLGVTYRTDKSIEAVLHMQVTDRINIGYAYDYLMSDISPYAKGAHEVVLGYNFNHERLKFTAPRFCKEF